MYHTQLLTTGESGPQNLSRTTVVRDGYHTLFNMKLCNRQHVVRPHTIFIQYAILHLV